MGSCTAQCLTRVHFTVGGTALGPIPWAPPLHYTLQHPEAAGLTKRWNGLLKVQLPHQLRGNTQKGWSAVLPDIAHAGDQSPPYGAVSQVGRTHGSKNQGVEEGGAALLIITLSDSFRESVLPTHTTLSSVRLESRVSKRAHECQRTQQRSY